MPRKNRKGRKPETGKHIATAKPVLVVVDAPVVEKKPVECSPKAKPVVHGGYVHAFQSYEFTIYPGRLMASADYKGR
jgi:hypothetical protein